MLISQCPNNNNPWSDGTSHLLFTKEEFLEKLSALIPQPRSHLVKWSGIFSPNSPIRPLIVLNPKVKKGFQFKDETENPKVKNPTWSKMLAKVFKIDVTICDHCHGKLRLKAAVNDQESIVRYLKHQGIDSEPPARAPPIYSAKGLDFRGDDLPNYNDL